MDTEPSRGERLPLASGLGVLVSAVQPCAVHLHALERGVACSRLYRHLAKLSSVICNVVATLLITTLGSRLRMMRSTTYHLRERSVRHPLRGARGARRRLRSARLPAGPSRRSP